jgi:hypothetical protein
MTKPDSVANFRSYTELNIWPRWLTTRRLINMSDVPLEDAAYSSIGKVLKYAVAPKLLPIEDFLSRVEKAVGSLPEEAALEVRQETVRIFEATTKPKNNVRS